jgi:hypothetical protein
MNATTRRKEVREAFAGVHDFDLINWRKFSASASGEDLIAWGID